MSSARVLLEESLRLLRLTEDAPLSEQIDAAGMAALAQSRAEIRLGGTEGLGDWACLRQEMGALLGVPASGAADLASWISALHARLRRSHALAFAVAALRLDGLDDALIAARLDLGPRLVRRIRLDFAEAPCS